MKNRLRYVTGFAVVVAVWNAVGVISRIEYIARKLSWIWKVAAMNLSLAGNIVLLVGSGAWLLYYRVRVRKPTAPPPTAAFSPADERLFYRAGSDLASLQFQQRVALRLIYRLPGQFAGAYIRQLEGLGFPDGEKIIKSLLSATVLVNSTPQMGLFQSPHAPVAQRVADEMAKPDWAGI